MCTCTDDMCHIWHLYRTPVVLPWCLIPVQTLGICHYSIHVLRNFAENSLCTAEDRGMVINIGLSAWLMSISLVMTSYNVTPTTELYLWWRHISLYDIISRYHTYISLFCEDTKGFCCSDSNDIYDRLFCDNCCTTDWDIVTDAIPDTCHTWVDFSQNYHPNNSPQLSRCRWSKLKMIWQVCRHSQYCCSVLLSSQWSCHLATEKTRQCLSSLYCLSTEMSTER